VKQILRACEVVAEGPAKYAAVSPGNARVSRKVTMITPIILVLRQPVLGKTLSKSVT